MSEVSPTRPCEVRDLLLEWYRAARAMAGYRHESFVAKTLRVLGEMREDAELCASLLAELDRLESARRTTP
jgi:hypothetical protein